MASTARCGLHFQLTPPQSVFARNFLPLFFFPVIAGAGTLKVGPAEAFATIQAAIDAAGTAVAGEEALFPAVEAGLVHNHGRGRRRGRRGRSGCG